MLAEREVGQMPSARGSFCPALVSPAAIAKFGSSTLKAYAQFVHPRHRVMRLCQPNQRFARNRLTGIALAKYLLPTFGVEMASADRRQMLRRTLSSYLRTYPQACDTADEIARWWMLPHSEVSEVEVLPLLDELLEKSHVTEFSTLEGRWLYRRLSIDAQRPRVRADDDEHRRVLLIPQQGENPWRKSATPASTSRRCRAG